MVATPIHPSRGRRRLWTVAVVALFMVAAGIIAVRSIGGRAATEPPGAAGIAGLLRHEAYGAGDHTTRPVTYRQVPPASGPHDPTWQNCGFYAVSIRNENAVHSLEHGAVWLTYRPDLSADGVAVVRSLTARTKRKVLASPYAGLSHPVVLSAWGYQVTLDQVDRARMAQFVEVFAGGANAPEPEGPCSGGTGNPSGS